MHMYKTYPYNISKFEYSSTINSKHCENTANNLFISYRPQSIWKYDICK